MPTLTHKASGKVLTQDKPIDKGKEKGKQILSCTEATLQQIKKERQSELVGGSRIPNEGSGGLSSTCYCKSYMQGVLIGMKEELDVLKKMVKSFINRVNLGLGSGLGQNSSMSQA